MIELDPLLWLFTTATAASGLVVAWRVRRLTLVTAVNSDLVSTLLSDVAVLQRRRREGRGRTAETLNEMGARVDQHTSQAHATVELIHHVREALQRQLDDLHRRLAGAPADVVVAVAGTPSGGLHVTHRTLFPVPDVGSSEGDPGEVGSVGAEAYAGLAASIEAVNERLRRQMRGFINLSSPDPEGPAPVAPLRPTSVLTMAAFMDAFGEQWNRDRQIPIAALRAFLDGLESFGADLFDRRRPRVSLATSQEDVARAFGPAGPAGVLGIAVPTPPPPPIPTSSMARPGERNLEL